MNPSTPKGFAVRLLEADADVLEGWLAGIFDDEAGFLGNPGDPAAGRDETAFLPPDRPADELPPFH